MPTFAAILRGIQFSYTLGAMCGYLESLGYPSRGVSSCVLCADPAFVLAAAQARATIGA